MAMASEGAKGATVEQMDDVLQLPPDAVASYRALVDILVYVLLFFFSSRRRHTRWNCDWSSDVCSSDLATSDRRSSGRFSLAPRGAGAADRRGAPVARRPARARRDLGSRRQAQPGPGPRSEERRVGKEGRSRWWAYN